MIFKLGGFEVPSFRLHNVFREIKHEGGRRREYLDAHTALHSVLMLQPWETSPVNAVCEEPPDYMHNKHEDWQKAWELRMRAWRRYQPEVNFATTDVLARNVDWANGLIQPAKQPLRCDAEWAAR